MRQLRRAGRAGLLVTAAAAVLAIAAPAAHAVPVTVGFDDLPVGMNANEAYAARGIHFGVTPQGGALGAVTVGTSAQARSAPNVGLLEYDASNDFSEAYLRFDTPQTNVVLRGCRDVVANPTNTSPNLNAVAFDRSGNQVTTSNGNACTAGGALAEVVLTGADISYVLLSAQDETWFIDDIAFDGATAPVTVPPADFTLALGAGAPPALAVAPGASATIPLAVTRNLGSSGRIGVAVGGAPPGVTATIDPAEVGGTAPGFPTLRVTAAPDAAPTQRTLTVTATPLDASAGPAARTLEVPLIVQGRVAVRIEGIEVTQAVQTNEQPTRHRYDGVALVRGKKTVVRVFADLVGNQDPRSRRPSFGMVLFAGGVGGKTRPGSPLFPEWAPPPSGVSLNDGGLTATERNSETGAFTFVLPDAWARGNLTLTALAVGTGADPATAATQLCLSTACGATPSWRLARIRFRTPPPAQNVSALKLPQVIWAPIQVPLPFVPVPLTIYVPTNRIEDFEVDPRLVFQKLQALSPVGFHFSTGEDRATDWPSWRSVRFARSHAIWEAADAYDEDIGRPGLATAGIFVSGDNRE